VPNCAHNTSHTIVLFPLSVESEKKEVIEEALKKLLREALTRDIKMGSGAGNFLKVLLRNFDVLAGYVSPLLSLKCAFSFLLH